MVANIEQSIKKLANGKAQDIDSLQAKFLKWGMKLLAPYIKEIFSRVNQDNFLVEWTTSVVIPLHKTGDINNPSNYHTIMIDPLLGKKIQSMLERELEKKRGKNSIGIGWLQA